MQTEVVQAGIGQEEASRWHETCYRAQNYTQGKREVREEEYQGQKGEYGTKCHTVRICKTYIFERG